MGDLIEEQGWSAPVFQRRILLCSPLTAFMEIDALLRNCSPFLVGSRGPVEPIGQQDGAVLFR